MKSRKLIPYSKEELNSLFYIDKGVIKYKKKKLKMQPGDAAGYTDDRGYVRININQTLYWGHRIAFLMHTGKQPMIIDHIDGNPSNNDFSNLREATVSQNNANSKCTEGKTSKYKGVAWHAAARKWEAYISIQNKKKHLGLFSTETAAANAYDFCASKVHGKYAKLNFESVM